jgi:hypothetical protein
MEEYGRRLLAEMCTWRNMAEGCWPSYVHGRIWQKVVGWDVFIAEYGRRLFSELYACQKDCWMSFVHGSTWKKVVGWGMYMEEYGRRLPAELCAWTNLEKVVDRAVCMEEYDGRLKAELC